MKVLLIRNAARNDFGGAETYQVSLAQALQEQGCEPVIVTRSAKLATHAQEHGIKTVKGWWWSRQNWSGVRILLVPLYILWQIMLTAWYLGLIARTRATVLHVQSKDDFIAATAAGRIMRKRVVWTDHMDLRYVFLNVSKPLRNPVGKLVYWAAHWAHRVVLISDNEHRLVAAHFKRKDALKRQIVIIKNGVLDIKQSLTQHKTGDVFEFCLVSRVVANKGIGEAIDAFAAVQHRLKDKAATVRLNVYGDGADMNRFKQQASANKSIVFHGHQTNAMQKMNDADVFMLPSYQEGFSISLLEATMLQKAIIASNVDSNPELVVDEISGLLVEPRDADGLAEAMYKLYADADLRNRLALGARRQYEANFNLATITKDKIVPLYKGHSTI